jgi:predicted ATPase/class 3 adenylate cyclase/Tfp pilus assembly protein PilF
MRKLPTGTVTFLFTDIEGSTRLLQELGDSYAETLAKHRRVLRHAFDRHGGVEVDTQGDAFFVAFAQAGDAVAAAEEGQRALQAGPLRVRMGIHSGEAAVTEEGYVGVDVHRAARICSTAHGGQIVVSEGTQALLDGNPALADLGLHRLKDLAEPVKLFQLGSVQFPPLRSLNATNLPTQPTPLVGRERELAEVVELLASARLVTVTGAGGSGKTRLALQAATELVDDLKDGIFWVSLAPLTDPELVLPTIASVLGAKEDLAQFVDEKRMLLLLDNLEQILGCAPALAELLRSCPNLKLLATSRTPLRITGEQEFEVPPLSEAEGIELFTQRARQVDPRFEPSDDLAELCRRLDGLPLALELAAARVKVLSPLQILERLGGSLDLLTTGARDLPERQRTLRAAIEWSYDLLDEAEKRLFGRLGVFAGSFDLEAAEEVADANVDLLGSLIDKSLLRGTEEQRFFMLETIREFARERLGGELGDVRRRHASYFLAVAETEEPRLRGAEEAEALRRLRSNLANLRAGLESALAEGDAETALRLAGALHPFWYLNSYFVEGRHWAEQALSLGGTPTAREKALGAAGEFALLQGEVALAKGYLEERLEVCVGLHDPGRLLAAHTLLGHVASLERDFSRALDLYERALVFEEEAGEQSGFWLSRASALNNVGFALVHLGRLDEAERTLEASLRAARGEGTAIVDGAVLNNLGRVALARCDADALRRRLAESLRSLDDPPDLHVLSEAFELLARLCILDRRLAVAARAAGAAERARERLGLGEDVDEVPHRDWLVVARDEIGSPMWQAEVARGRAAVDDDPLRLALDCLD